MRFGLELARHLGLLRKKVGQGLMKTPTYKRITGMSLRARFSRWWTLKAASNSGTALMTHTGFAVACFLGLAAGMYALSSANGQRLDDQQFRERNIRLAEAQDAGAVLRADETASRLLQHDWLRSVEYSLERDPSSALSRYAAYERDRAALDGLESFQAAHMKRANTLITESKCLAQAIYYEARSESVTGQLAVAEVIFNRVADHRYPNSVCEVVFQGATRTTGCQFTFTCDGAMRKTPRGEKWVKANKIASHVMMGLNEAKTAGATHYHATYVNSVWNSGLVKTRKIGTHIFYRFPRGAEWAQAKARMDARLAQRRSGLATVQPAVERGAETQAKALKSATGANAPVLKTDEAFKAETLNAEPEMKPAPEAKIELAEPKPSQTASLELGAIRPAG